MNSEPIFIKLLAEYFQPPKGFQMSSLIESIIEVDGQRWRCKARTRQLALDEIAHARVTGSVGSSTTETRCGGSVELLAEVQRID